MKKILKRIEENLAAIEKRGLRRILQPPTAGSVDLSSNDYLNLANDERLKAAMTAEIAANGVGATGSRLLRGEREIFQTAEQQFAAFKQTERALFFNSGYAANIGVMSAFLESGDAVFSDELNHASLIDGIRLSRADRFVFPHNDFAALKNLIQQTPCKGQRFVVVESLFSMDGDFAPLAEYQRICLENDVALIVDEAHAVGVFGAAGSGLIEQTKIADAVFLSINTAGKALGAAGAFVCGSASAIEYLIQKSRPFIFSTAAPPSIAAALIAALEIIKREPERREKLLKLSAFLRKSLNAAAIKVPPENSQIIPIIIGKSEKAVQIAAKLQTHGFDARAIRPPTVPADTARLRISLNSNLDEKVLQQFVSVLQSTLKDFSAAA